MNENEMNNIPSESNPFPTEERNEQMYDSYMEPEPPSPFNNDDKKPQEGFTFKWINLILGVAIFLGLSNGSDFFTNDWTVYIFLAVVVIIHEMGHVIAGKSFGCYIQEMQVFFLAFLSYKPKQKPGGSSWRNITWSLGVLPLGGVTMFKTRESEGENDVDDLNAGRMEMDMTAASSPYIDDKPAWQRLLISAAGVLCNIATFLVLYFILPHISSECFDFLWPLIAWSLILAIINILPIYPLDGGAIVFALYEIITGKKPSPMFTKVCGWIGFIFIILFFWVFPEWLGNIIERVFDMLF